MDGNNVPVVGAAGTSASLSPIPDCLSSVFFTLLHFEERAEAEQNVVSEPLCRTEPKETHCQRTGFKRWYAACGLWSTSI